MSQPITLTDEQRDFRAVVRQFVADKITPLAAETDRTGEYSWDAFKGAAVDGAHGAVIP